MFQKWEEHVVNDKEAFFRFERESDSFEVVCEEHKQAEIYCKCRKKDESTFMICCDGCGKSIRLITRRVVSWGLHWKEGR
jgi:hypothetical protein